MSHHELEEEPGMLQDSLSHGAATDHPLQSQLLVQQLGAGARVTESGGACPVPSSGGHSGAWIQRDGSGLVQPETMQERERKESAHPFPGPSRPCWASGGDSTETVSASSSLLSGAARVAEADLVEGRPGDPNRFLKVESKP